MAFRNQAFNGIRVLLVGGHGFRNDPFKRYLHSAGRWMGFRTQDFNAICVLLAGGLIKKSGLKGICLLLASGWVLKSRLNWHFRYAGK